MGLVFVQLHNHRRVLTIISDCIYNYRVSPIPTIILILVISRYWLLNWINHYQLSKTCTVSQIQVGGQKTDASNRSITTGRHCFHHGEPKQWLEAHAMIHVYIYIWECAHPVLRYISIDLRTIIQSCNSFNRSIDIVTRLDTNSISKEWM